MLIGDVTVLLNTMDRVLWAIGRARDKEIGEFRRKFCLRVAANSEMHYRRCMAIRQALTWDP